MKDMVELNQFVIASHRVVQRQSFRHAKRILRDHANLLSNSFAEQSGKEDCQQKAKRHTENNNDRNVLSILSFALWAFFRLCQIVFDNRPERPCHIIDDPFDTDKLSRTSDHIPTAGATRDAVTEVMKELRTAHAV